MTDSALPLKAIPIVSGLKRYKAAAFLPFTFNIRAPVRISKNINNNFPNGANTVVGKSSQASNGV